MAAATQPRPTTPLDVAESVADTFDGEILTCKISEDMHGMWDVIARIKPTDGRKRHFVHSAHGETRNEAIDNFIESAQFTAAVCEK